MSRLESKGFDVRGYDANTERSECASIVEACAGRDVVLLSLPNGAIVEEVVAELAGTTKRDAVVVDCSTDDPGTARRAADELSRLGVHFLDAPVSGGREGAARGELTFLVGGNAEALELARPVISVLAAKCIHVGPTGSGQVAKLVNNLLVATQLVAVGECVRVGEAAGVDAESLLDAVNQCSGRSAVSEVNFPRWIVNGGFDSGFSMGLMRKDVGNAADLAARLGVPTDLVSRAAAIWADENGPDDEEDFNRIVERN